MLCLGAVILPTPRLTFKNAVRKQTKNAESSSQTALTNIGDITEGGENLALYGTKLMVI